MGAGDEAPEEDDPEADDDDEDEEEIRDPLAKIKALTQANARLARRKKQLEKELGMRDEGASEEATKQLLALTAGRSAFASALVGPLP